MLSHMDTRRHPSCSPLVLLACCAWLLAGCGTTGLGAPDSEPAGGAPPRAVQDEGRDPLKGFNRAMYTFNEKLDKYVMKPLAKGYRAVVPTVARRGVANFFSNLSEPITIINDLLQGKLKRTFADLGRFVVNTTIGIFGIFDPATSIGLEKHDEDFGQTLAVWGVDEGPYLVLPFFGPSNLRDGVGLVADYEAYPPTHMEETSTRDKLILVEAVSTRDRLLDATDILEQAAGEDPYIFVREAYRQRRRNQVYDGNPPQEAPDSLLFEEDPPAKPPVKP